MEREQQEAGMYSTGAASSRPSLQQRARQRLLEGAAAKFGWNQLFDATFVINVPSRGGRRLWTEKVLNESFATGITFHAALDRAVLETDEKRWSGRMVIPASPKRNRYDGQHDRWVYSKPLPGEPSTWQTDNALWPPNRSAFARQVAAAPPAERPALGVQVRNLGKIACYMSHLAVFKEARRRQLEHILVFEDDIAIADPANFHERLFAALATLPADFDLFNFGWAPKHYPCVEDGERAACGAPRVCRIRGNIQNNAAYVVHRRAFRWLIPLLEEPLRRETRMLFLPLDLTLRGHYITNDDVKAYGVTPTPLIKQLQDTMSWGKCGALAICHSGIGGKLCAPVLEHYLEHSRWLSRVPAMAIRPLCLAP